jgi:hypothetical protein
VQDPAIRRENYGVSNNSENLRDEEKQESYEISSD